MNKDAVSTRPVRKELDHSIHFHGRFGATYFITICCQKRGVNQLCNPEAAQLLFETARQYHASQQWYLKLLLLMPDHLHISSGSRHEREKSNGSGISSITDCAMMKVNRKSLNTFGRIRCELD
jgi:hypothetical protein